MATIYIHPTAATPGHIKTIQARTGRIAVLSATGAPRLVTTATQADFTAQIRQRLKTWTTQIPAHTDHNWPPGAA